MQLWHKNLNIIHIQICNWVVLRESDPPDNWPKQSTSSVRLDSDHPYRQAAWGKTLQQLNAPDSFTPMYHLRGNQRRYASVFLDTRLSLIHIVVYGRCQFAQTNPVSRGWLVRCKEWFTLSSQRSFTVAASWNHHSFPSISPSRRSSSAICALGQADTGP